MQIEKISVEQAMEEGKELPFLFLRKLSSLYIGKSLVAIDSSEIVEAKYFDNSKEIRIVKRDNGLSAVKLVAEENDKIVCKTYTIQNAIYGKEIDVACHLEYDEDGQGFIKTRRFIDWREYNGE